MSSIVTPSLSRLLMQFGFLVVCDKLPEYCAAFLRSLSSQPQSPTSASLARPKSCQKGIDLNNHKIERNDGDAPIGPFDFMRLPLELRQQVYDDYLRDWNTTDRQNLDVDRYTNFLESLLDRRYRDFAQLMPLLQARLPDDIEMYYLRHHLLVNADDVHVVEDRLRRQGKLDAISTIYVSTRNTSFPLPKLYLPWERLVFSGLTFRVQLINDGHGLQVNSRYRLSDRDQALCRRMSSLPLQWKLQRRFKLDGRDLIDAVKRLGSLKQVRQRTRREWWDFVLDEMPVARDKAKECLLCIAKAAVMGEDIAFRHFVCSIDPDEAAASKARVREPDEADSAVSESVIHLAGNLETSPPLDSKPEVEEAFESLFGLQKGS